MATLSSATTFFDRLDGRFGAVPAGPTTDTALFLKACRAMVPFFDVLGSTAFSPVKSDINGNITKLQGFFDKNPAGCATLQAMVQIEVAAGTTTTRNSATDALLWLSRALAFVHVFLSEVNKGEHDLAAAATTAYHATLAQHHNFLVRGIFSLAMNAVPYWADFVAKLGNGAPESSVVEQLKLYDAELAVPLSAVEDIYKQLGA